jgi:poly-gamma-glutamate capsule biosynthesis protein CapA/YwtB (metallophosphatase superfamily)
MNTEWIIDDDVLQDSLLILGDIHAGAASPSHDSASWRIAPSLLSIMGNAGACIANLEGVLGDHRETALKTGKPSLGTTDLARQLRAWHISLVSLANNHAFDFSSNGLGTTLAALSEDGIRHVGAGINQDDAWKHENIRFGTTDVAILGISHNEFGITHGNQGGVAGFDEYMALRSIHRAKAESDRVVILYHGGIEYLRYPSPQLRRRCRFLVEAGADAIICQHSHIAGASEMINGKAIIYGQGDFIARTRHPSIQAASCPANIIAIRFDVNSANCEFRLLPIRIRAEKGYSVQRLSAEEMTEAMQEMENLNELILDEGRWLREWESFVSHRGPILEAQLAQASVLRHRLARRMSFFRKTLTGKHRTSIENLIRCEAHREPLIDWLQEYPPKRQD